jgi:Ni/Co efflux regulator RcnB
MAQLAVAAAGAAVGLLFGAPQAGWLVGSFIGSQLFAEQRRVEGPRLGDLQVQASTYGMGIPQVFGSMRLAGNVIWARPLIEKRHKQSAGKGGGGQKVVSYEYFATFAVAFARGPVDAIRRVWADGKLLVDLSENAQQGKSWRYGERIYRAEQLGTSEWRLSRLLRGRRGTEWAMATHQVGETVLVLEPATLTRTSSLDEVGLARFYRAVSIGSDPSLPDAVAFTNQAASLKPYAPVHLRGTRNGGGDLTISWVRRTRYSGEWRDLVDVPLNEASEAYEVDVLNGAAQAVRTLSSTNPSVTYSAAAQTTDFGAPQTSIEVAVHQLSAAVGRGFAGRATL